MGYKLKAGQGVDKGIRRVVSEEIDEILAGLAHHSRATYIHEARKAVKRIRAALRLARGAFSRKTFTHENQAFRDINQHLSQVRDADVLVQAFDQIKPDLPASPLHDAILLVGRHVTERRRVALRDAVRPGQAVDQTRTALQEARTRVESWQVKGDEWPALKPGFQRTYAEGQERFEIAYEGGTTDQFHAWRRRVKDLMYQVHLLHGLWPAVFDAWGADLDQLATNLGEHHDLAVLRDTIQHEIGQTLVARDRNRIAAAITKRCARLEADAHPLGRRLYVESPKQVSDRLADYWKAWRAAKQEEEQQPAKKQPAKPRKSSRRAN